VPSCVLPAVHEAQAHANEILPHEAKYDVRTRHEAPMFA